METTFRIQGLTELLRKEQTVGAKVEGELATALQGAGGIVARDAAHRYQPFSVRGGAGIQTKVFVSGVYVVQTIRKARDVTKRRPNFGPLMMRKAFLPALRDNETKVIAAAEAAVEQARARYWET